MDQGRSSRIIARVQDSRPQTLRIEQWNPGLGGLYRPRVVARQQLPNLNLLNLQALPR